MQRHLLCGDRHSCASDLITLKRIGVIFGESVFCRGERKTGYADTRGYMWRDGGVRSAKFGHIHCRVKCTVFGLRPSGFATSGSEFCQPLTPTDTLIKNQDSIRISRHMAVPVLTYVGMGCHRFPH